MCFEFLTTLLVAAGYAWGVISAYWARVVPAFCSRRSVIAATALSLQPAPSLRQQPAPQHSPQLLLLLLLLRQSAQIKIRQMRSRPANGNESVDTEESAFSLWELNMNMKLFSDRGRSVYCCACMREAVSPPHMIGTFFVFPCYQTSYKCS